MKRKSFKDINQKRIALLNQFMEEYKKVPTKRVVEKYEETLRILPHLKSFVWAIMRRKSF